MKLKIIVASVLVVLLSAGISTQTKASPWRGGYRHGWYRPHPVVGFFPPVPRVFIPPVPVPYVDGYYGRRDYGRGYYAPGHYYGRGYERGYGHGYAHGHEHYGGHGHYDHHRR